MRTSIPSEDGIYCCPHAAIKRALEKMWRTHKALAMANSHARAVEAVGDGINFRKWCTLCGQTFITVNETRQTCADCQKKIFRKDDRERDKRAKAVREELARSAERQRKLREKAKLPK